MRSQTEFTHRPRHRVGLITGLASLAWSTLAFGGPSAKTEGWVNYWDDPANVREALLVGVGLLVVAVVVVVIGWVSGQREEARRKRRRRG